MIKETLTKLYEISCDQCGTIFCEPGLDYIPYYLDEFEAVDAALACDWDISSDNTGPDLCPDCLKLNELKGEKHGC